MSEFDELLHLEEDFYNEGYQEGHNENLKSNFLEGKQFGLQVGFQRFVLLGQMVGICDVLDSMNLQSSALSKNVQSIRDLISKIGMTNDDENVEELEKIMIKLKNKFRTIMITFQRIMKKDKREPFTFEIIEEISRIIAGEVQGFVEDEDVSEAKTSQDQAQAW
ncbi:ribosome biosynthesis protein [Maudiozyma humilis]|uniref:Ribosome biosynthesis protein n=1 Tax=Maudiozyma humilis TaxID=51915 RepID=A0AAV5S7X0_MAUHU|nr:ribosome biosynthesis protein [Kazachstania humilis]